MEGGTRLRSKGGKGWMGGEERTGGGGGGGDETAAKEVEGRRRGERDVGKE